MQALICDSCAQPITDMNNRVQVLIFTPEPIADPQLDLCANCGVDVVKSTKVKRGVTKAKERIQNWMPTVEKHDPTGDPIDDYQPQGSNPRS